MQEEDPGLGESDDEMAGFIDDDDVGARQGRARSRGRPKDLSSHGTQAGPEVETGLVSAARMPCEGTARYLQQFGIGCRRCKISSGTWMTF